MDQVRVNLRHVPEALRPPQETPDPNDDPTSEWRTRTSLEYTWIAASAIGGTTKAQAQRRRHTFVSLCLCGYSSQSPGEDLGEFIWRHNFQLRIRAIARLLVQTPSSKVGGVAETAALHVIVFDFSHQLGAKGLPRQILALTPAAPAAGYALKVGPLFPRMIASAFSRYGARRTAQTAFAAKLAHTPT